MARATDPPVVLIKWYDFTKWLLERIDSFPKNQRFIFGQRLADHALDILQLLVEAAYSSRNGEFLVTAQGIVSGGSLRRVLMLLSFPGFDRGTIDGLAEAVDFDRR